MTAGQPTVAPRAGTHAVSTDGASATAALAEWATGFGAEAATHELHDVVRDRLLDYCANGLGGAPGPFLASLLRYARRFTGRVPLPDGSGSVPEMAALVYGAAAHALESDDTHQPSSSPPGVVICSTLPPLALATDADWDSFVTATVAGYEVMCRIGQATGPAAECVKIARYRPAGPRGRTHGGDRGHREAFSWKFAERPRRSAPFGLDGNLNKRSSR